MVLAVTRVGLQDYYISTMLPGRLASVATRAGVVVVKSTARCPRRGALAVPAGPWPPPCAYVQPTLRMRSAYFSGDAVQRPTGRPEEVFG